MSHTIADGFAMLEAAPMPTTAWCRLGSQRIEFLALCAKARQLYREGAIGNVEFVELTMGRNDPNGAWVYPPPDVTPQTL